ncbi:MAG TPA: FAD-binding oxidoreductase [Candidatus Hydrogenedentes bacterium]|nr:FAD-binding oxidoreductase [Candidatus Hydrogenedentota bacterium]
MSTGDSLRAAVEAWTRLLGEANVRTDDETIARYARTTQDAAPRPGCVVFPESTEQVQEVVRIAGRHGVVVYPISRGRNWGYGDACAPTPGAAIVDLSRMNTILEVNTELAYAVIQPGVSQGQLYAHLAGHKTGLWMDSTGAGPESSLVGNTLDRGFGHTRYGDHFETCCGMEVVLADGRVLDTGFGHFANAKAGRVYRYGVGPFFDGLFCQSNFGIVTKIGLWLMPRPEDFCFFFCTVKEDAGLERLIDALRPFRLRRMLDSAIHIGNDLRVLSSRIHYPWEAAGQAGALPKRFRQQLRQTHGIGEWSVGGALTGTRGHVRDMRRLLRRTLGPLGKLIFVDDAKLALGERVARVAERFGISKLSEQLASLRPVYAQMKGAPADESVHGTQWRLRHPPDHATDPRDPLETGCGLMWFSPVVPMTGRDARRVLDLVKPVLAEHDFDLLATFTLLNERSMIGILNVAFDKSVPDEVARAMACYDAAMKALIDDGYVPYRTGLRGMDKIRDEDDVFWQVAREIKQTLDPGDIIARGRYVPPLKGQDSAGD